MVLKFKSFNKCLVNFEIQKYYQSKLNLMVLIQEIILLKIKDGAYVINLDENKSIRTL